MCVYSANLPVINLTLLPDEKKTPFRQLQINHPPKALHIVYHYGQLVSNVE